MALNYSLYLVVLLPLVTHIESKRFQIAAIQINAQVVSITLYGPGSGLKEARGSETDLKVAVVWRYMAQVAMSQLLVVAERQYNPIFKNFVAKCSMPSNFVAARIEFLRGFNPRFQSQEHFPFGP